MNSYSVLHLEDLRSLAKSLAKSLTGPVFIALYGTLGAGKTTFVRFLIEALMGQDVEVPSPTFTLVQTYETPIGELWHCDLYRLEDPKEVLELGLVEAIGEAIFLVEWPEKMGGYLPRNHLEICIKLQDDEARQVTFKGVGKVQMDILKF